ncbi:MAG: response regulator [Myxococcales bacterium]|nr:response regulator [Myxococcales bacterium]
MAEHCVTGDAVMEQDALVALLLTRDAGLIELARGFTPARLTWDLVGALSEAERLLSATPYAVFLIDIDSSAQLDVLDAVHRHAPDTAIVVLGAEAGAAPTATAIQRGADEYLSKQNLGADALLASARVAVERRGARRALGDPASSLEAVPLAVAVVDRRGLVSTTNRAWRELALDLDCLVAQLKPGADALATLERLAIRDRSVEDSIRGVRSVLTGEAKAFRTRCSCSPRLEGAEATLQVEVSARPEGGSVLTCTDITDMLRAEAAQRSSEHELWNVMARFPHSIAVHREGVVLWVNQALLAYLGYREPGELVGRTLASLLHSEDAEEGGLNQTSDSDNPAPTPAQGTRLRRADGSSWLSDVQSMPVHFDGEPATLVLAKDVSQQRELVARMMQADRMQSVGLLTAAMGHEINNPLSFVTANVDVALRQAVDLEQSIARLTSQAIDPALLDVVFRIEEGLRSIREALTDARQGSRRVQSVVQDLRSFARPENLEDGPVKLEGVIDAALSMVWNEIRHRAQLVKNYETVPYALGNEARLGQVFLNLLTNAAHAIPVGSADSNEIRVRVYPATDAVVTEISDTGTGIAAQDLPQIFEPFFTTKPQGQGTGLGLPICRDIVRNLGGDIDVESTPGKGTTFRIRLPSTDQRPRAVSTLAPLTPPRSALRVLVVDDEPMMGRVVGRCLGKGRLVEWVGSGREALTLLSGPEHFDAVLLDVMMPEMTGIDVYEKLRQEAPERLPRIVFLTGGAFTPLAREFLERVPNRLLAKPFEAAKLRQVVDELASERG